MGGRQRDICSVATAGGASIQSISVGVKTNLLLLGEDAVAERGWAGPEPGGGFWSLSRSDRVARVSSLFLLFISGGRLRTCEAFPSTRGHLVDRVRIAEGWRRGGAPQCLLSLSFFFFFIFFFFVFVLLPTPRPFAVKDSFVFFYLYLQTAAVFPLCCSLALEAPTCDYLFVLMYIRRPRRAPALTEGCVYD